MAALPQLSSTPYATGGTVLFGAVEDEADVATLIAKFADLGLYVVEMRPLPDSLIVLFGRCRSFCAAHVSSPTR